jgi:hypothetical protein
MFQVLYERPEVQCAGCNTRASNHPYYMSVDLFLYVARSNRLCSLVQALRINKCLPVLHLIHATSGPRTNVAYPVAHSCLHIIAHSLHRVLHSASCRSMSGSVQVGHMSLCRLAQAHIDAMLSNCVSLGQIHVAGSHADCHSFSSTVNEFANWQSTSISESFVLITQSMLHESAVNLILDDEITRDEVL